MISLLSFAPTGLNYSTEEATTILTAGAGEQIGDVETVFVDSLPLIPDWFEPEFIAVIRHPLLRALLEFYFNLDQHDIDNLVSANYTGAQTWVPRRDPLTLDLDGGGLETVALNPTNPIYFDHDGDGNATATGWISPHDGFLVLDRNGNGVIDNGRELFGDATPLSGGGTAADGFEALSAQDTNLDGRVDNQDTNFANLRIWQDLNQNGISESNELFTLTQKGIASINVTKTENNTLLPNGNVIADLGSYTKTDGTTGTLGDTAQLGDIDLREDTFNSQFTDTIPLTPEAQALPGMQGSGQVRDLREAVSLSSNLTTLLTNYSSAMTREEQLTQLDALIQAWSDTSTLATTATGAYAGHPLTITFTGITEGTQEHQAWLDKLTVLERFNGRTFRVVAAGTDPVTISFSTQQMDFLTQSYEALKESLFNALFLQTRGKPYLDVIGLITNTAGNVILDFSSMESLFAQKVGTDARNGLYDTIDFVRATAVTMFEAGWNGPAYLGATLRGLPDINAVSDVLTETGVQLGDDTAQTLNGAGFGSILFGGGGADTLNGTVGSDILLGEAGNDTLHGEAGNDTLNGGAGIDYLYGYDGDDTLSGGADVDGLTGNAGNDTLLGDGGNDSLYGNEGNDILDGGADNDTLDGGTGADTFRFGRGGGQDRIGIYGVGGDAVGTTDVIEFSPDVLPTDVTARRGWGNDNLVLSINGTPDSLTVDAYLSSYGNSTYAVEEIRFADGTVWDIATVKQMVLVPTEDNDYLKGYEGNDTIEGLGGNDTLWGDLGADTLDGGAGNDTLHGEAGNDTLNGGAGIDYLYGYDGDDTLSGGADVDGLTGNAGNDTLLGDGGNDSLYGNEGNDILDGGADNDTLDGGTGADFLDAGPGDDTLVYSVDDLWTTGFIAVNGGSPGVPGTGSRATIAGKNHSYDVFEGGDGYDVLIGSSSDDALALDDQYSPFPGAAGPRLGGIEAIYGNGGNDVIDLTSSVYAYGDVLLNGGPGDDVLWSSAGRDTLDGGDGNDNLYGGAGDDILQDQAGNDTLDGGPGADAMAGGTGNDIYLVDNPGDTIMELPGEGTDTVKSAIDYTLGTNLENLTLTGTTSLNGWGNGLNNVLTGNTGVNVLAGGLGNDTYVIGPEDSVAEFPGEGTDTVRIGTSYTLGDNIENLALTGTAPADATGNALNNVLTGNGVANRLNGAAGNDSLRGGLGDDTYVFETGWGVDTVVENDGTVGNTDTAFFDSGIGSLDLVFTRSANDLRITRYGSADTVVFKDWNLGEAYHTERFQADNQQLLNSQVDQLIQAMAQFSANNGGITWDQAINQQPNDVQAVLAAYWQPSGG